MWTITKFWSTVISTSAISWKNKNKIPSHRLSMRTSRNKNRHRHRPGLSHSADFSYQYHVIFCPVCLSCKEEKKDIIIITNKRKWENAVCDDKVRNSKLEAIKRRMLETFLLCYFWCSLLAQNSRIKNRRKRNWCLLSRDNVYDLSFHSLSTSFLSSWHFYRVITVGKAINKLFVSFFGVK